MTEIKQKQSRNKRGFTYLAIVLGAIGANYGINYGLGKLLGNSEVFEKEQPYFEIPDLFSEEEVQNLREYVLKHNRFLTGKEAWSPLSVKGKVTDCGNYSGIT